jgi:hypothetical protein
MGEPATISEAMVSGWGESIVTSSVVGTVRATASSRIDHGAQSG